MRTLVLVLLLLGCRTTRTGPAQQALDDLVVLTTGERLAGRLLTENANEVVIAQRWGTFTLERAQVQSVQRQAVAAEVVERSATHRLPPFSTVIQAVSTRWTTTVQQVPATVVDQGVLRHVPYISHRAGNVELNVYGDPDAPSCIEVGLKAPSDADKEDLRAFIASVLPQPADQETAKAPLVEGAPLERAGLTFEVTPATAPDAYGAWWVSVYDVAALDASRAGADELQAIAAEQAHASSGWNGYQPSVRSWRGPPAPRVYTRGYARRGGIYVPGPPVPRLRPPRFPFR